MLASPIKWLATSNDSPAYERASSVGLRRMPRESNGCETHALAGRTAALSPLSADGAADRSSRYSPMQCFAVATAARTIASIAASTTSIEHARSANAVSRSTSTQKPFVAQRAVLGCSPAGTSAPVYDLTVDGEHEFFANGVLVHNCLAAAKYMIRKVNRSRRPFPPLETVLNGQVALEPAYQQRKSSNERALTEMFGGGGRVRR
jgi:hypothetical protein